MPASDILKRARTPSESQMAGNPASFDAQGLQMPPEVMALISSLLMPPVGQGIGQFANQIPGQMGKLSEAGAIFPEGVPISQIPKDAGMMQEFGSVLSPSQQSYVRNQMLSDWHAQNLDWPRVLADKWAMLTHAGGN